MNFNETLLPVTCTSLDFYNSKVFKTFSKIICLIKSKGLETNLVNCKYRGEKIQRGLLNDLALLLKFVQFNARTDLSLFLSGLGL